MMVFPSGLNQASEVVVLIYIFGKCVWMNTYPPQRAALELDTKRRRKLVETKRERGRDGLLKVFIFKKETSRNLLVSDEKYYLKNFAHLKLTN